MLSGMLCIVNLYSPSSPRCFSHPDSTPEDPETYLAQAATSPSYGSHLLAPDNLAIKGWAGGIGLEHLDKACQAAVLSPFVFNHSDMAEAAGE